MSYRILFAIAIVVVTFFNSCTKEAITPKEEKEETKIPKDEVVIDLSDGEYEQKESTVNLPARDGFEMIKFKGQYWFMGGKEPRLGGKNHFNDIWNSTDGENWEKVVETANWLKRRNFNLFEFDEKLWIAGGENHNIEGYLNDIWCSSDGINWTQVIDKGPWETRSLMSVSVHDNKIYLIGGHSTTTWHMYQDIWESVDGKNWKKVGSISDDLLGVEESRQGIYAHQVLKLEDTYYLIGGNISTVFVGFV